MGFHCTCISTVCTTVMYHFKIFCTSSDYAYCRILFEYCVLVGYYNTIYSGLCLAPKFSIILSCRNAAMEMSRSIWTPVVIGPPVQFFTVVFGPPLKYLDPPPPLTSTRATCWLVSSLSFWDDSASLSI